MDYGADKFNPKSKEIDGKTFVVTPFNALEAMKLQVKLAKIFGPALGGLISEKGLDSDVDISKGIMTLFMGIDDNVVLDIIRTAFKKTECEMYVDDKRILYTLSNPNSADFDTVFRGTLMTLYKVIWFVVEVNYPDFLELTAGIGDKAKAVFSEPQKKSVKRSAKKSEQSELFQPT